MAGPHESICKWLADAVPIVYWLILSHIQLVCFYYILTTFTTVGYGECIWPALSNQIIWIVDSSTCYSYWDTVIFKPKWLIWIRSNNTCGAGDVYATTEGERVNLIIVFFYIVKVISSFWTDFLCLSLCLCCFTVWNNNSWKQWNYIYTHHKKEEFGRYSGILPHSSSKVMPN